MPSQPAVATVSSTNSASDVTRPRRFRWKTGLVILLLGVIAGVAAWFYFASNRTDQNVAQLITIMSTMLLLTIWWTFFSGVRWRVRMAGWLVVVLMCIGLRYSVRIEGFRGEAFPILVFRWQETSEERAAKYWEKQKLISENIPNDAKTAVNSDGDESVESTIDMTADGWSQYRGNRRMGMEYTGTRFMHWRDGGVTTPPKELWRHPVGPAWSSFAVSQNLAITQEQQQENEAVVCYDLNTGEPIWVHTDEARFYEFFGGVGPRATPTIHDGRVYALGATGLLNCLDLRTGEKIWQTNILTDAEAENIMWGMSASPLIVDDMVIVNPGGKAGKSVAAYDRITGAIIWAQGDHPASYSSPILATIAGVRQILLHDGHGATGINPEDGRELWRFPWTTQPKVNVAMPTLVPKDRVLIGSGYGVGSALLDIKHEGDNWTATTDWSQRESRFLKPKFNDFIVVGKYAYGLDEGIMVCVDLEERKQMWKKGRYGYGQFLMVPGMFIVLTESGEVVYVKQNPKEHEELYRWQAIEGKTWNHPALAYGKLLVRNAEEAACFELPVTYGSDY
ncbi:MAG: PQQ-binding-like beta-propeller repeat protein [Planctomycetaceae bacterium]